MNTIIVYEQMGDSAVIRRCFSHEDEIRIPDKVDGIPVRAVGPYCFSAQFADPEMEQAVERGLWKVCFEYYLQMENRQDRIQSVADIPLPALCGMRVHAVTLGCGIARIGRYCFYNCNGLEMFEFPGTLADFGSGLFSGCHHLKQIRIQSDPADPVRLKNVLDEIPDVVTVDFLDRQGKTTARLVFPEFFEEGIENTPARILMNEIHGSGIRYRNCFSGRKLDIIQYDRIFVYACAEESFSVLSALVRGRLQKSWNLTPQAKLEYERFVRVHAAEFALEAVRDRNLEELSWLTGLMKAECTLENDTHTYRMTSQMREENNPENAPDTYGLDGTRKKKTDADAASDASWLDTFLQIAAERGYTEGISYLMEQKNRDRKCARKGMIRRRRLEL